MALLVVYDLPGFSPYSLVHLWLYIDLLLWPFRANM